MPREHFNELIELLYSEKTGIKQNSKFYFFSKIKYLTKKFFSRSPLIYYLNRMYEIVKDEIKKIYNLKDEDFKNLEIRIVPFIFSPCKNSVALGAYSGIKDLYGKLYKGIIYIPYWLIYYPKKFIETLAHEMVHYIQDLKEKLKPKVYKSFYDYYFSPEEIEARITSKKVTRSISIKNYLHNTLYSPI